MTPERPGFLSAGNSSNACNVRVKQQTLSKGSFSNLEEDLGILLDSDFFC